MGKTYNYLYRIFFPTRGWFYYGIHSTNDLNDGYCGSPVTHREKWDNHDWEMDILQFFDTRGELEDTENKILKNTMNDSYSLNEHYGGGFSLDASRRGGIESHRRNDMFEHQSKGGKTSGPITGRKMAENGHCQRISYLGGKVAVESGQLERARRMPKPGASYKVTVTIPETGEELHFGSVREVWEFFPETNRGGISACVLGKNKTHMGLQFRKS